MVTKREWLVTQGLAKPGRGKFSTAAHAALSRAASEGMTFDDDTAPVKPVVKIKTVGPVMRDFKDLSPKAVRAWGIENPDLLPNGITVSPAGRINVAVYEAYVANVDKPKTRAEDAEHDLFGETPRPRFDESISFKGEKDGKTVIIDGRQICSAVTGGCGYSLWHCRCPQDARRHAMTSLGIIEVSPVYGRD